VTGITAMFAAVADNSWVCRKADGDRKIEIGLRAI